MINVNEYLWVVLVPVAKAFREQWCDEVSPFSVIKNGNNFRVKFVNEEHDSELIKFCISNELKNDEQLEY